VALGRVLGLRDRCLVRPPPRGSSSGRRMELRRAEMGMVDRLGSMGCSRERPRGTLPRLLSPLHKERHLRNPRRSKAPPRCCPWELPRGLARLHHVIKGHRKRLACRSRMSTGDSLATRDSALRKGARRQQYSPRHFVEQSLHPAALRLDLARAGFAQCRQPYWGCVKDKGTIDPERLGFRCGADVGNNLVTGLGWAVPSQDLAQWPDPWPMTQHCRSDRKHERHHRLSSSVWHWQTWEADAFYA
jgi:hypothetical protein